MTQKETTQIHFKRMFPFLITDYRRVNKRELKSLKTLKELFGDAETDLEKLTIVFKYQSII